MKKEKMNYQNNLKAEVDSWCIEDDYAREEKILRERIRHPKLIKDLLLDKLPTHKMDLLEVGGGPEPISDLLQFKSRIVIDPCTDEYKKYFYCPDHVNMKIEDMLVGDDAVKYDLIISTNSLDHVEKPELALRLMNHGLRAGGYMALLAAERNAITNPHPAHEHNLTLEWVHQQLDYAYETCWELSFDKDNYRYGHVLYEGKRGQPAWAILLRKTIGYE